jgi:hypothetical protein
MIRVQIVGFLVLGPGLGSALQTPLLRGVADLMDGSEVFTVSWVSSLLSFDLALTANLALLWGSLRVQEERTPARQLPRYRLRVRRLLSVVSVLCWVFLMHSVRKRCVAPTFWAPALAGLVLTMFVVVGYQDIVLKFFCARNAPTYRLFLVPLPLFWGDRLIPFWSDRLIPIIPPRKWGNPYGPRLRRWILRQADRWLGPGFLDYEAPNGPPRGWLTGHAVALTIFIIMAVCFEVPAFSRDVKNLGISVLAAVLVGLGLLFATLSFAAFFADRHRFPLSALLLLWITATTKVVAFDHVFYSEPVDAAALARAPTPAEVLASTPPRFIVVAAAGGGIQASAWAAQVLAGLSSDDATGTFHRSVRVISGVSGGSVGAMYFLGTYDGVWGSAVSPDEARQHALASSLAAVAWGVVYPDLHRLFLPISSLFWRNIDRGSTLERSLAMTAGRDPGPTLLELAPLVRKGLPVVLLNATLTADALPIVFSNSRFPGADDRAEAGSDNRQGLRSFHDDFRLETRLETAVRLSASFPLVSPAAQASMLRGRNAFVDGGYFDNSGLYSLMAWLRQAAASMGSSEPSRDVLLLQIDAFPETQDLRERSSEFAWYRQFSIPIETVIGVRETGQVVRNRAELPLLTESLNGRLNVERIELRFRPSPRCALEPPPLSWHLTKREQECIGEGWSDARIVKARKDVSDWLRGRGPNAP